MSPYLLTIFTELIAALAAFVAVNWIYFKILRISKEKNLVDKPNARKLQNQPIPVLGGHVVFFGIVFGLLTGYAVGGIIGVDFQVQLLPLLAVMVVMLYIGTVDDMQGLSPTIRLIIEVISMLCLIYASGSCIDTFHGLWGIESFTWWLAVPLTVFAGVGIINAVNMIDGVNGLCSTLCMLCSVLYGIIFLRASDVANAVLAFSVAASLFPFIVHNVFGLRSRMYIGDSGTMVMGMLVTWFTISFLRSDSPVSYYYQDRSASLIAFAIAVLCVPVFDTIRVMMQRVLNGRNPMQADKTHLHHAFLNVGVSHFVTTFIEVSIVVVVVAVWLVCNQIGFPGEWQLYVVLFLSLLLVWGTYGWINMHARRHTEFLHRIVAFNIQTHLGRTHWWKRITAWLDAPEGAPVDQLEKETSPYVAPHPIPDDPTDLKELDRKRVLDFMRGRAEVLVIDIIRNSGANRLRIYSILYEEEQSGRLRVIRRSSMGGPEIVALN